MADFLGMSLTTVLDYGKAMAAGHVVRTSHPFDGRALELSLNRSGIAAHEHREVIRKRIERNLSVPVDQVRRSLAALDDSAEHVTLPRARLHSSGFRQTA